MIAEDVLERGLRAAAEEYDVPTAAPGRLRAELMPREAQPRADVRRRLLPAGRSRWVAVVAAGLAAVVGVPLLVGGSGGSGSDGGTAAVRGLAEPGAPSYDKSAIGTSAPPAAAVPAPRAAGAAVAPASADATRVVKTGHLRLSVPSKDVSPVLDKVVRLAGDEGGYVADSSTSEAGGSPTGMITLRVPVDRFEDAVSKLRGYGTVEQLDVRGKDVTSEYVDLKARIGALRETRKSLLTILTTATTVGATLAVQDRITDVQTQIDQLTGQLNVLSNQASYGTLTVDVAGPEQKAAPAPHKSGLQLALERSVRRFVHGVEAIVGVIGPLLLVLLLVGLAWAAGRPMWRRLRRRLV